MGSAVEILERLCAKNPDDPDLRAELGTAFRHLADIRRQGVGNNEESEAYSRRALTIHQALTTRYPTRGAYSLNLAWDSLGLGATLILARKYEEAETLESRAATIMEGLANEYPGVPGFRQTETDVLGHRAIAFLMTGNRRGAEKMIGQLQSGNDEGRTAANLAFIAWHLVHHGAPPVAEPAYAVELSRRSLALRPESVGAWHAMGMARYRAGQWDEAIKALTKANELEHHKGLDSNGFFLAMAHHKKGDAKQARSWYDRSVSWVAEHKVTDPNAERYRNEAAGLLGVEPPETKANPKKAPDRRAVQDRPD